MISVYLASVDFHLTRLRWSKVSSSSANPLTRDKETETASILLVTSSEVTIVLSSFCWGLGARGSHGSRAGTRRGPRLEGRGAEHRASYLAPAQLQRLAQNCPAQSPSAPIPGPFPQALGPVLLQCKTNLAPGACSLWHISPGYF